MRRPRADESSQTFVTRGRVAQAMAAGNQALLEQYGMPPTFPTDLGAMLDPYEVLVNGKHAGRPPTSAPAPTSVP